MTTALGKSGVPSPARPSLSSKQTTPRPAPAIGALLLGVVCLGAAGCGADGAPAVVDQELGASERCNTVAPDRAITGSGSFVTSNTYDHPGQCAQAYVVDVNNYSTLNDFGTLVAFGGAAPTSKAACEGLQVQAFAWRRNADGTTGLLGSASQRGVWATNSWREAYCQVPHVVLEQRIPGYAPGSSYRLAMRAQALGATGAAVSDKITFVTAHRPQPVLPVHVVQHAARSLAKVQSAGAGPRSLANVWALRGTVPGGIACRDWSLKLAVEKASRAVYTKLGASSTTVASFIAKEESIYTLLCNTPNATAAQQATFNADVAASLGLLGQIYDQIAARSGLRPDEAAFSAAQLLVAAYNSIVTTCGPTVAEVGDFLHDGTLPPGMPGPNVLMKTCGQGLAALTSSINSTLGLGGTAVQYTQCMEDAFTTQNGICSDPRASNADPTATPAAAPPPPPSPEEDCDNDPTCNNSAKIEWELVDQIAAAKAGQARALAAAQRADNVEVVADLQAQATLAIADEMITFGLEIGGEEGDDLVDQGVQKLIDMTEAGRLLDKQLEQVRREAGELLRDSTRLLYFLCGSSMTATTRHLAGCPTTARCPGFDFANGSRGWYAATPDPGGETRPLNGYDRVNHCLCQALGGRIPGTCSTQEERQKEDCLTNPLGPDDGPRPECVLLMQPAQIDRTAIEARICTMVRPNCTSNRAMIDVNGDCGCATGIGQAGTSLTPRCASVVDCADGSVLDERTCLCQPLDAGGTPFVEPKGCAVNAAGAPGGLDQWRLSSPGLVGLDRKPVVIGGLTQVKDTLSFAPGKVAAAMPVFRTEEYYAKGTSLFADVSIPTLAPASGKRGIAQAHMTVGNSFNDFVGSKDLTTLSPGVQRVTFPLSQPVRDLLQKPGNNVRITLVLDTDVNAPARTGLVNLGFTGTPLPTATPSPICPIDPKAVLKFTPRVETALGAWPF